MESKYKTADLSKIKTIPIKERQNLVKVEDFAEVVGKESSFREFIESLCSIHHRVDAASNLRNLIHYIGEAKKNGKPVVWGIGPHVVKYGLSPLIINLMGKGFVSAITLNGACAIHDTEIALIGETSEEMTGEIQKGRFGMAAETGELINGAAKHAYQHRLGLGEAIGFKLTAPTAEAPFAEHSLLANAYKLAIPATVHVAIGTDIIHTHPTMDGAATGAATFNDFRILTETMKNLGGGGVYINIASTVILPEVFLKTLTAANNLRQQTSSDVRSAHVNLSSNEVKDASQGGQIDDFTTADFNHLSEYRPLMNVVKRPTEGLGRGYEIIGRIEITIPLLIRAILEIE